jgi:cytosine/adenosine deaminase-related metal-dependent hydrolase
MDLGRSRGGLPPDEVVEDRDAILAATDEAIDRHHDSSPGAMTRIAVAPCSPFSVSEALLVESAALARRRGVRLHTHLAETIDEEQFCLDRFGCRPVEYLERLGWLGADVWLAHCVHIDDAEVARFAETGTGVAHCPSSNGRLGTGIAPIVDLVRAGVAVGLGVDGAASNEAGELGGELRQALLSARLRSGAAAMTARDALALGTIHGARCLGRADEIGSLEVGKRADVALWRIDDIWHAGIDDPVAALVLGATPRVHTLFVEGRAVVEGAELRTGSEQAIARDLRVQSARLLDRARAAGVAV